MRWSIFAFGLLFLAPSLYAGRGQGNIACFADHQDNKSFKKKLWKGYEVSLGPARNHTGGGDDCTAAIYNAAGKVVFRTTGFNVIFDEDLTGQDFDGDGEPEVVFQTDSGGGMHCCWAYNVVSLSPKPYRLFDIDAPGAVRFEKDGHGKMVIWRRLPGPYGFTSMARQPFAERVFRVQSGKLVDVTPEFCSEIFSNQNEDYSFLTPQNLVRLQSTGYTDNEETASDLLSRALQHVFCREFERALSDLDLWPSESRAKMKADFAGSVKDDYPEFALRLTGSPATH